jgi:glycosyltransferase involved in cell wall biosynthesis
VVQEYAEAIVALMDDEPGRTRLGQLGRARVEKELAWPHQRQAYIDVYQRLSAGSTTAGSMTAPRAGA